MSDRRTTGPTNIRAPTVARPHCSRRKSGSCRKALRPAVTGLRPCVLGCARSEICVFISTRFAVHSRRKERAYEPAHHRARGPPNFVRRAPRRSPIGVLAAPAAIRKDVSFRLAAPAHVRGKVESRRCEISNRTPSPGYDAPSKATKERQFQCSATVIKRLILLSRRIGDTYFD